MTKEKLQYTAQSLDPLIPQDMSDQEIFDGLKKIVLRYKAKFEFYTQDDLINIFFNIISLRKGNNFDYADQIRKNVKFICVVEGNDAQHEFTCDDCQGQGYQECDECSGDGREECNQCDGSGLEMCEWCDGEGEVVLDNGETDKCDECDGKKEVDCGECEGSGRIDCSSCNGGTVYCDECNGKGEVTQEDVYDYDLRLICSWNKDLNNRMELVVNSVTDVSGTFERDQKDTITLQLDSGYGELDSQYSSDDSYVYYYDDLLPKQKYSTQNYFIPEPENIYNE